MTKTEMAEFLQDHIDKMLDDTPQVWRENPTLFDRHFKELFDDFKVKLQESVEESIEYEEQDFVEQDETEPGAFGSGSTVMEGE